MRVLFFRMSFFSGYAPNVRVERALIARILLIRVARKSRRNTCTNNSIVRQNSTEIEGIKKIHNYR